MDEILKTRKKDIKEINDFIEKYSIRSGGIQIDRDIDKIKKFVIKVLLDDYGN